MPNRRELGYVSAGSTSTIVATTGYGVATGGTSSSITVSSQNYTLLTFTSDDNLVVSTAGLFDVLLVGGGASAGRGYAASYSAGGGGGGGILGTASTITMYLGAGTYSLDIGAGGATTTSNGQVGVNGSPSKFSSLNIVLGGGGGGTLGVNGLSSATGGGDLGGYVPGSSLVSEFGFGGGTVGSNSAGGGGGGAGGAGSSGTGGNGRDISGFIGGSTYYAGAGGGGGAGGAAGLGGVAGTSGNGNAGVNYGAGGSGGGTGPGNGGAGAAGAIFVRFKV